METNSSTSFKTYKYRIYPNKTQLKQLDRIFSIGWRVWNDICNTVDVNHPDKLKINHYAIRDLFCEQRHNELTLQLLPAGTIDDLVRRHKKSVSAFWDDIKNKDIPPAKKRKWPHAKDRKFFTGLGYKNGAGFKFIPERDKVARVRLFAVDGLIRLQLHRPLPENCKIKYAVITVENKTDWYVSLQLELQSAVPERSTKPAIGIDIGLVHLLALSDGAKLDHPKWYIAGKAKRKAYGQRLDRQRRFNNPQNYNEDGTPKEGVFIWKHSNRMKAVGVLARKLDKKAKHQRWYFWHVITDWLTREYGSIALEELNLDFMIKNGKLATLTHDAGLGMFRQFLESKAEQRGVEIRYVNAAYTSQTCHECGHVCEDNRPDRRIFKCVSCGHEDHADINAAKNILRRANFGAVQTPSDEYEESHAENVA